MSTAPRTVRVCGTADVAVGAAARFDLEDQRICVVHLQGPDGGDEWCAVGDRCSHADYSLAEGEVWPDDRTIECPKHGSTFSLLTGEALTLPATRPVPVYDVTVVGDDVTVGVAEPAS